MKQVLVRGGQVTVEEVPRPQVCAKSALVRISHSLISSGTESALVSEGGAASYLVKKAQDPLNVRKLKRKLATVGVRGAIEAVRDKLATATAPGYSAAGVIVACGEGLYGFEPGDRVACAGIGHACHAEYNVTPQQLLTPIPENVSFEDAAFTALGAVALHGVRRAEPTLGETFVVMGLGLVGQIAAQILRAAGCRVIGADLIAARRSLALELGANEACPPEALAAIAPEMSAGYGVDGVLICAGSRSSDIANTAISLCRPRGRVVVVGDVGMNLDRPALYANEVEFRLSCSYGPGRYDPAYEEAGVDYPIGHVRWTEGRNMAEFLRLVAEGKVRVTPLAGKAVPVECAQNAYAALADPEKGAIAALLDYGMDVAAPLLPSLLTLKAKAAPRGSIGVGVIGAGQIARAQHLPNLVRLPGCHVAAVADLQGHAAQDAATRVGARLCTTDYRELLASDAVDAVLIATQHNTHAQIALDALRAGKHVFVEKPLALMVEDAQAVCDAVAQTGRLLTVGFNRRFSRHAQAAKAALAAMPGSKMVVYRCNAGPLPKNHWAADPAIGGGRILGECVHFFDFVCWLIGSDVSSVHADGLRSSNTSVKDDENLSVSLRFADGSVATVIYCGTGHEGIPKERIEVFGGNAGLVIDDFRGIEFAGLPGKNVKPGAADKGMAGLLKNFIQAIRGEAKLGVTAADGLRATRIACQALESARRGREVEAQP